MNSIQSHYDDKFCSSRKLVVRILIIKRNIEKLKYGGNFHTNHCSVGGIQGVSFYFCIQLGLKNYICIYIPGHIWFPVVLIFQM